MTHLKSIVSRSWADADPAGPRFLMLHGYGASEHDLAGLSTLLPGEVPWASLRAPLDTDWGGAAWFPLTDRTASFDFKEFNVAAATAAAESIWSWVDANAPQSAPLIPIGFSQGGFMSVELLRSRPGRIAGIVFLSGLLDRGPREQDASLAGGSTPVFWGRGDADPVIPQSMVDQAEAWLSGHTALTTRVYPGLGHGIHEREMADVNAFLASGLLDPAAAENR